MPARLLLESPVASADEVEVAARLETAGQSLRLWWRVPGQWRSALTRWADPFVIAFAFHMMQAGQDVRVEGPVSPSLLANLQNHMDVWQMWEPRRYRRVQISSDEEAEPPEPPEADAFVLPFSAGVDSCFTTYRHARHLAGRTTRRLGAAITMFGFDIREGQSNARPMYEAMAANAARMLASLGIPHVQISSNFRTLPAVWAHAHGTQLVSGLALFGGRFGGALIPNSVPANQLSTRWGSHPLLDPMLSSQRFPIIDDGGTVPRWQKIQTLAAWPEGVAGLRVCFGERGHVGNCGHCEKCIRTALAFKICDATPPADLPIDPDPRLLRGIRLRHEIINTFWRDLIDGMEACGKSGQPYAKEIRRVVRRGERHQMTQAFRQRFIPLRNQIRKALRGSPLSRKELAAQRTAERADSTPS